MKKVVVFILAFLYLGLTTGLAVNIHYCMGKIAEVKFDNLSSDEQCAKGCTKMPCCGHNYHLVKVNDEHQQAATDYTLKSLCVPLHTTQYAFTTQLSLPVLLLNNTKANSPPLLSSQDICIRNCTFRI